MFYVLLKIVFLPFTKLESKWIVESTLGTYSNFYCVCDYRLLFGLVGRPIIKWLGITQDNLHPLLYWILFITISLFFYQVLLVVIGWIFGQFQFFWNFEKKMIRRFGLGRFLKD